MSGALALRFGEHPIDVVTDPSGMQWFVGRQVCAVLGIRNSKDALGRLDDDERDEVGIADLIGRQQGQTVINEPGLYSLILRSRKPEAKAFKRWVTHEVLPAIRRTGSFGMPPAAPSDEILERLSRVEAELARLGVADRMADLGAERAPQGTYLRALHDEYDATVRRWLAERAAPSSFRERAVPLGDEFRRWAEATGNPPLTQQTFGRTLRRLGGVRHKHKTSWFWDLRGVQLALGRPSVESTRAA